jgi:hypothetical protein
MYQIDSQKKPVDLMDNPPGAWITCGQSIDNKNRVANTLPTGYPHP